MSWLQNTDNSTLSSETIYEQYEAVALDVRQKTVVTRYGDMGIGELPLSNFLGSGKASSPLTVNDITEPVFEPVNNHVHSHDVKLNYL